MTLNDLKIYKAGF